MPSSCSEGVGSLDELGPGERMRLEPDDTGIDDPAAKQEDDDQVEKSLAESSGDDDADHDARYRHLDGDHRGDDTVDPAADEAGERTEQHTDDAGIDRGDQAHPERESRPLGEPRQQVP